jgi:hypothetical protein
VLLVDEVFPEQPVRQWVLNVPYPWRFLFASRPAIMGRVLGIVCRCIATHLIQKAGFSRDTAQTGAVTLMDRAHPCARPSGDLRSSKSAGLPIGQRPAGGPGTQDTRVARGVGSAQAPGQPGIKSGAGSDPFPRGFRSEPVDTARG